LVTADVNSIQFDETRMVTCSDDFTIKEWAITTLKTEESSPEVKCLQTLRGHTVTSTFNLIG